jgi:hypothetical protein
VECPDSLVHVWNWFLDLDNARTLGGMGGINPITYTEILAFFTLMQIEPFDFEVKLIKKLDRISMQSYSQRMDAERKKAQSKAKAKSK